MTSSQKANLALSLLWIIVQLTMLGLFGIGYGGDTGRYLGAADGFLHGELPAGKSVFYLGYDLFVTVFMATPLGEAGIISGQLAVSALAALCMYKLGTHLYSARAGYLAALLYIGFLKLHPWNVYVLTDSLFISLTIISTYVLLTAKTMPHYTVAGGLIFFTTITRPDGIAVLLAALAYSLYALYARRQYRALGAVTLIVLTTLPLSWYAVGKIITNEDLLYHYELGAVIWSYEPLYQSMPGELPASAENSNNPLNALIAFVWEKPVFFVSLAVTKLWYEIIHVRPFHAPLHNFLILATVIPLYVLAFLGLRQPVATNVKLYLLAVLAFKAGIVAFTFADWTGRFLLHVMPIILLLAAGGLSTWRYDVHHQT